MLASAGGQELKANVDRDEGIVLRGEIRLSVGFGSARPHGIKHAPQRRVLSHTDAPTPHS